MFIWQMVKCRTNGAVWIPAVPIARSGFGRPMAGSCPGWQATKRAWRCRGIHSSSRPANSARQSSKKCWFTHATPPESGRPTAARPCTKAQGTGSVRPRYSQTPCCLLVLHVTLLLLFLLWLHLSKICCNNFHLSKMKIYFWK